MLPFAVVVCRIWAITNHAMKTIEKPGVRIAEVTREGFNPERLEKIFAGIGRLMPQLDENFPSEPNLHLLNKMVDRDHLGLIAALLEDDTVVGTLSIGEVTEPAIERGQIGAIVVDEDWRGQGIADQMIDEGKAWAERHNLDTSLLQTEQWRGLEAFYSRHGSLLADTMTFEIPSHPGASSHA